MQVSFSAPVLGNRLNSLQQHRLAGRVKPANNAFSDEPLASVTPEEILILTMFGPADRSVQDRAESLRPIVGAGCIVSDVINAVMARMKDNKDRPGVATYIGILLDSGKVSEQQARATLGDFDKGGDKQYSDVNNVIEGYLNRIHQIPPSPPR